ncbi:MAG: hypothetical protein BWX80_04104 [Candidatus Hydrogenedentes bacterium ADurb.Bin101]|nr:MAG: hypothetical protein BWX80_04104 [Candidatus Hydrogenedentes bacterium ADurb.Bin101]
MPVHRADIIKPQFLEKTALGDEALDGFFKVLYRARYPVADEGLDEAAHILLGPLVGPGRDKLVEIMGQRADVPRNGHLVVVENDQQFRAEVAGMVHGFESHAARHGAIADDGRYVMVQTQVVPRHRHAQRGRNGRGTVSRAETVKAAFGNLGISADTVALAQRIKAAGPAGQQLVGITLVAHVPD